MRLNFYYYTMNTTEFSKFQAENFNLHRFIKKVMHLDISLRL